MGIIAAGSPCVHSDDWNGQQIERNLWTDRTDYTEPDAPSAEDDLWWAEATRADPEWWAEIDADAAYWDRYESAVVDSYLRDRVSDFDQPWYRGR